MDEWQKQVDRRPYYVGIAVIIVLALFGWLRYDSNRNKPVYNDTNATMERIEKRIQSVEQRLDTMSKRFDQAEKTINDLGGRIESSTVIAKEVATGIDGLQERLDDAVQRSGRIKNIITDIEATNK